MIPDIQTAFQANAKPMVVRFDDHQLTMDVKTFSTGSIGWYASGKIKILLGEVYVPCQVSSTVTVIGSKNFACQQTDKKGPPITEPVLMGPEYPYNENPPLLAPAEPEKASPPTIPGDDNHTLAKKKRRRAVS